MKREASNALTVTDDVPDEVLIALLVRRIEDRQNALDELQSAFSDLERANRRLVRSERNKTRFLSLIRNEFNNPLLGMVMLLKGLIQERGDDPELKSLLEILFYDALSVSFHMANVVSAANIESGQMEANISCFNLYDMLMDVQDSLSHLMSSGEIQLAPELDRDAMICQDLEKLQAVMRNIMSNAFRFSPKGSAVTLEARISDRQLQIIVRNLGKEISDMDAIFDPFYQEDLSYGREHHGLGLGLSVVKGYVSFMRGHVKMVRDGDYNELRIDVPVLSSKEETFEQLSLKEEPFNFDFEEQTSVNQAF
jgi:two-component system phosphate regulon sensor histidine kinase PhoR